MEQEHDKKAKWAQFRFSVIAPLICRKLEAHEYSELKVEILKQTFVRPDGRHWKVPRRTLNDWIQSHREGGFENLHDANRSTFGTNRKIPEDILAKAVDLRKELPTRSVRTILKLLKALGFDTRNVSKSTLNGQLNRRGASKQLRDSATGTSQRWEQKFVNKLWQGDTSEGLWLPDPANPKQLKLTRLISFIDDASRVVPHAEFYWDERLPSLIDCFRKALLKRGKPERCLFDNAFIYHSNSIVGMCANLDIELSFCEDYSPESKGKIEKSFGTVKAAFFEEAEHSGLNTLDELNQFFWAWLANDYHRENHSSLNMTPLERWKQDESRVELIDPDSIKRALMIKGIRTVNRKTSLLRVDNKFFQATTEFAGKRVDLRWHADAFENVEIWFRGKLAEIAPRATIEENINFEKRKKKENLQRGLTFDSSKKYRESLLAKTETEAVKTPSDSYLSLLEFQSVFEESLYRKLEPEEQRFLSNFFFTYSPIRNNALALVLLPFIATKGKDLHVRSYLDHIRISIFKSRS
jgi:transposase InsO family protein